MPDYSAKNQALLRLIGECDLALKDLLEYQVWDDKEVGHVLSRLAKDGSVEVCHHKNGLSFGGVTWCKLTPEGCEKIGLPRERGQHLSESALHTRLALHWACHSDKRQRLTKLDHHEVQDFFGDERMPPNVPFLVGKEDKDYVAYRCYIATGMIGSVLETARKIYTEMMDNHATRPYCEAGQLALLVLCATPEKCASVREALDKRVSGAPALGGLMRAVTKLGPSPRTIGRALRDWRKERANG